MAGLEPARAFYGPTDFKSVASAISPHRRHVWCSLSSFFSGENEYRDQSDRFRHAQRSLELRVLNLVKEFKMPKYWMINDRSQGGVGPDINTAGVTYWVSDKQPLTDIKNWRQVTQ